MTHPSLEFLDLLPDPAFVMDEERRVVAANDELSEAIGTDAETLHRSTVERWLSSASADVDAPFHSARCQVLVGLEQATRQAMELSARALDVDGKPHRLVVLRTVSVHDAARIRHHEAAIGMWEIGLYEHDHLTEVVWASPRVHDLYGLEPDEELTLPRFAGAVHPADQERGMSAILAAHDPETGGVFDLTHRIIRGNGDIRWVHSKAVTTFGEVDGERRPILTTGTVADVTERVEAGQARARQTAILDATPDFVGITDPRGRILYLNSAARRFLGLAPSEDVSERTLDIAYPEQEAEIIRSIGIPTAIRDGAWRAETQFRSADGEEVPTSQVILAHFDTAGELEYLSTVARDLRREKALEAQFRQAQKMEAVGRLAGGIAHDFNNLLSVILGFATIIREDLSDARIDAPELDEIVGAADRAAALTHQLLAFSRKQILKPRVVDANEIVSGLEPMMRRLVDENIRLEVMQADRPARLKADPNQVEQILMNLVVNGRDAMPSGGHLIVEVEHRSFDAPSAKRLDLSAGHYVAIAVSDTGHGMDAATRERVFEPFFTTKAVGAGTGLGLATVFGIVRQSGGAVWVYSEPGQGSTFKVYFPTTDEPVSDPIDVQVPNVGRVEGTVLVVEDDAQLRNMVATVLARAGLTVLHAANPIEALGIAGEHDGDIELLLTDVVMPGMSGRELAEALTQRRPEVAVLYMSGYTENSIVHHGVLDDDVNFLPKPLAPAQLLQAVADLLPPAKL